MAIAFNDQQRLAGQTLGISSAKALALTIMAGGLGAMNIYHMGNSITSKLLTPDSNILLFALLYFIAACIAFIEIPVTEEIVTTEAREGKGTAKGHRLLLVVVACMAMAGGVYSITTDAQKKDATLNAHSTTESSFEDRKQGLISDRNVKRSNATTTTERSQANSDYFTALANLKTELAGHQSSRPASAVETGSFWHWLWACGFSFLCSVGVIAITAYLTKYHKPLTEIPRVFFKVRDDQEWAMNDDDVRVIPAMVDLSGGSSTAAARKVLENRPQLDNTSLNTDFDPSVRTLDEDAEGGQIFRAFTESDYDELKEGIINAEIAPTVRPVKNWLLEKRLCLTDTKRQQVATKSLAKLCEETVLILNPEQGVTNKIVSKYILNPDYQSEEIQEPVLEQGEEMIDSICPNCETENEIEKAGLDEQGTDNILCSECYREYSAYKYQSNKQ